MPVIPFTEEDLTENEKGLLTDSQKKRLKPKTDLIIALSGIGAFFGFIVSLIFFFVGQNSEDYFLPTAVSLMIFGVCFYAIFWGVKIAKQVRKGYGVKCVEGFAELSINYSGEHNDVPNYNLRIRNVHFKLNEQAYDAFSEGDYRVFYFRLLRNELLAVEPLD
jgi:hypothetical protein